MHSHLAHWPYVISTRVVFKPVIDALEKRPRPLTRNLTPKRYVLFWQKKHSCVSIDVAGNQILSVRVAQSGSKVLRDQCGGSVEYYRTPPFFGKYDRTTPD
jgi:hypothetical protein